MESTASLPKHIFGSSSFATPLVISIIGIISTSLALVFYHLILVKFCIRRQTAIMNTTNNNLSDQTATTVQESPLLKGVDKKILETIPIISYGAIEKGYLFRVDQTECVVCLGELEYGEMVRLLPTCNHAFHVPCIDTWFIAHCSCPICRSPLIAPVNGDIPVALTPPFPPRIEETRRHHEFSPDQQERKLYGVNLNGASSSNSSSEQQSCSLLRHSSLALPIDQRQSRKRLITGLKRSVSLDQSSVIIEIQSHESSSSRDCSSSLLGDDSATRRLNQAPSLKHLDRVSTKLLKSISRLRTGRNSEILPY